METVLQLFEQATHQQYNKCLWQLMIINTWRCKGRSSKIIMGWSKHASSVRSAQNLPSSSRANNLFNVLRRISSTKKPQPKTGKAFKTWTSALFCSTNLWLLITAAPRFRNSIAVIPMETVRKRPHSIISVGSSSGASSSSSGEHRLHHSQCSSAESGIVSDWHTSTSVASDSTSPSWPEPHWLFKLA